MSTDERPGSRRWSASIPVSRSSPGRSNDASSSTSATGPVRHPLARCRQRPVCRPFLRSDPHRVDFLAHILALVASDPSASRCYIVTDHLNTHHSASLVRSSLTSRHHRRPGRQGRARDPSLSGHARRLFARPCPPDLILYTPKHTSWLNQIEIWFSILVRRLLRRASFTSIDDLSARVLAFIDYFNRTMAKPFQWTYQGKALAD